MLYHVAVCRTNAEPFPFWLETLSIFLGDVLATIFIGTGAYVAWYVLKYPGFRIGANWTYVGWNLQKMRRLPNESDTGSLELMPNISVISRDLTVKKIIASVWVRERADVDDPGVIYEVRHLQREGVPPEVRTTGGDLLSLTGPRIVCEASKFQKIFYCPIFIQTSDGEFYRAQSAGNSPKGILKLRNQIQDFVYAAKQRLIGKLS